MSSIVTIFNHINKSASDGSLFNVQSIPGTSHKIGVSAEGYPMFFVSTSDNDSMVQNLNAELLSVNYNVHCKILENDEIKENVIFSIIILRSKDKDLQSLFIEFFRLFLCDNKLLTTIQLAIKIEGLMDIFSALKKAPVHKLQGLWAELLLIETSNNPSIMAKAWHSSPESKYDFTFGKDKIEVKSTSSERRTHHFSLDQLNPSENSRLLIASIIVRESGESSNGLSINNLYERICNKISDIDLQVHVYTIMVSTLGKDFAKANEKFFDYVGGYDSLKFVDYINVPKINKKDVPELVSDVKFTSDLTGLDNVKENSKDYLDSELFKAVL